MFCLESIQVKIMYKLLYCENNLSYIYLTKKDYFKECLK